MNKTIRALSIFSFFTLITPLGCGGQPELDTHEQALLPSRRADVPVKARWLGASGLELTFDGQTFLVDPYLTRAAPNMMRYTKVHPPGMSWGILDDYLAQLTDTPVRHVVVSHTHWDHVADVPEIVKRTGAQVWGSPNLKNLMTAHGQASKATVPGVFTTRTIHDNPTTRKRVELTLYPAKHNTPLGLPLGLIAGALNDLLYTGTISSTQKPTTVGGYMMDPSETHGIYAIKLKFIVEDKATTFFITPPDSYNSIAVVRAPHETIDVLVLSITNWDPEEKVALPKILDAVKPHLVVPVHHDDYYRPLSTVDPNTGMPAQLAGPYYPVPKAVPYVVSFASPNGAEFKAFVSRVTDKGYALKVPQMFKEDDLIFGAPELRYTLIKAKANDFACLRQQGDGVQLGGCTSAQSANNWIYDEGTGFIRNVDSNRCLRVAGSALTTGACVTRWAFTDAAGLIHTTNTSTRLCLRRASATWASGTPVSVGPCGCNDPGQQWALLTATRLAGMIGTSSHVLARTFADPSQTGSMADPIFVERRAEAVTFTAGGQAIDRGAFFLEPATGYLRVADNLSYCVHKASSGFFNGNRLVVRSCYAGSLADRTWRYDRISSRISASYDARFCIHKKSGGWTRGDRAHLWSCTAGGDENKQWDLDASPGVPTGSVKGKVYHGDFWLKSSGVAGARVYAQGSDCAGGTSTDADGNYTISHVAAGAARKITVNPSCPLVGASKNVNVAARGTHTVNVALQLGATSGSISGTVRDDGVSALSGVFVRLASAGQPTRATFTNSAGAFSFSNVPVGVSSLTLTKKGYATQTLAVSLSCTQPTRTLTVMLK